MVKRMRPKRKMMMPSLTRKKEGMKNMMEKMMSCEITILIKSIYFIII